MVQSLGFRVQGLGFWIQGVQGLGLWFLVRHLNRKENFISTCKSFGSFHKWADPNLDPNKLSS